MELVDVRYPNEWAAGHIEGARHIPLDDLYDHLDDLDRTRPILTVCRSGQRSVEAAEILIEEGFDAKSLDGGIQAWAAQGRALVATNGHPGAVADPEEPPDDRPLEMQQLQSEFLDVIFAMEEHFGGRPPTEEETRSFLRERLIAEGRTSEEVEEFMRLL